MEEKSRFFRNLSDNNNQTEPFFAEKLIKELLKSFDYQINSEDIKQDQQLVLNALMVIAEEKSEHYDYPTIISQLETRFKKTKEFFLAFLIVKLSLLQIKSLIKNHSRLSNDILKKSNEFIDRGLKYSTLLYNAKDSFEINNKVSSSVLYTIFLYFKDTLHPLAIYNSQVIHDFHYTQGEEPEYVVQLKEIFTELISFLNLEDSIKDEFCQKMTHRNWMNLLFCLARSDQPYLILKTLVNLPSEDRSLIIYYAFLIPFLANRSLENEQFKLINRICLSLDGHVFVFFLLNRKEMKIVSDIIEFVLDFPDKEIVNGDICEGLELRKVELEKEEALEIFSNISKFFSYEKIKDKFPLFKSNLNNFKVLAAVGMATEENLNKVESFLMKVKISKKLKVEILENADNRCISLLSFDELSQIKTTAFRHLCKVPADKMSAVVATLREKSGASFQPTVKDIKNLAIVDIDNKINTSSLSNTGEKRKRYLELLEKVKQAREENLNLKAQIKLLKKEGELPQLAKKPKMQMYK